MTDISRNAIESITKPHPGPAKRSKLGSLIILITVSLYLPMSAFSISVCLFFSLCLSRFISQCPSVSVSVSFLSFRPLSPSTPSYMLQAVTLDLGDPTSPAGSVHSRHKEEVGRRLALQALHVAYAIQVCPAGQNGMLVLGFVHVVAFVESLLCRFKRHAQHTSVKDNTLPQHPAKAGDLPTPHILIATALRQACKPQNVPPTHTV